jgi:hypothetical protein
MSSSQNSFISSKSFAFWTGVVFLFGYWLIAFDGITFSDDVYYLLAGKKFWEGTMEFNAYHFSTRWGAYIPSGLMGFLFGFDPHRISLISLLSYLATLGMLIKILPPKVNPWILVTWFSTQVYFLHFLTKVYPDSLLVCWTVLIPFSATFRSERPFLAALGVISGLFFGFVTKETIVFLAPFPILLFLWDSKNEQLNKPFYQWILSLGFLFGAAYLAYFWIKFGDPLYRVSSINAGHYVSEFTYADKGIQSILRRISYLPILTFVERGYWLWVVMALPGLRRVWKEKNKSGLEFFLVATCILVGFWLMSSTLEFYNPIYLNPRHLIILVPILAFLTALGWEEWQENPKLKQILTLLILLGGIISLVQEDWKMSGFQFLAIGILYLFHGKKQILAFGILLLFPAIVAVSYQHHLKQYDTLLQTLRMESINTENQSIILTNNFLDFSKEVLLSDHKANQKLIVPIEKLDSLKSQPPKQIRVLIYKYYLHAYPEEQVDVDGLQQWLKEEYVLINEEEKKQIWLRSFQRKILD